MRKTDAKCTESVSAKGELNLKLLLITFDLGYTQSIALDDNINWIFELIARVSLLI